MSAAQPMPGSAQERGQCPGAKRGARLLFTAPARCPNPPVARPPARTRAQPARPSPQQCELPGAEPSGEARAPALGRAFPELARGVRGRERRLGRWATRGAASAWPAPDSAGRGPPPPPCYPALAVQATLAWAPD